MQVEKRPDNKYIKDWVKLAHASGNSSYKKLHTGDARLTVLNAKYLLESIVLFTAWAVPTVEVPIWHHRSNTTEPAIHLD